MQRSISDGRLAASLRELADMTGVSERTLRRWARDKGLPTYRVGGRVLVLVAEFESWLKGFQERPADVDTILESVVGRLEESSHESAGLPEKRDVVARREDLKRANPSKPRYARPPHRRASA